METNFNDARDLLNHAVETGRWNLLCSQLEKDYQRANVSFPFQQNKSGEGERGKLLRALRESLYFLLMENFDQYLNLMYAADVPEREFKNIRVTDAVEVATQVTFILLQREYKKVLFRTREGRGRKP